MVTPFTLAGAMAPVTMAGAVAQSLAEALCAVVLVQIHQPGRALRDRHLHLERRHEIRRTGLRHAGIHARHPDDRADGAVLRAAAAVVGGLCGQRAGRAGDVGDLEHLWAAVQSGTNMVYHAAGWLEGGLIASPEKFIMDCEVLQQIQRYMEPETCATTADDIALDAIREVGHAGHFFGIQHTQDRYTTAFYQPFLSDWRNYEGWEAGGAVWTPERAHHMFKEIIAEFRAAADGRGDPRGTGGLRRPAQAGGRRADRFLSGPEFAGRPFGGTAPVGPAPRMRQNLTVCGLTVTRV